MWIMTNNGYLSIVRIVARLNCWSGLGVPGLRCFQMRISDRNTNSDYLYWAVLRDGVKQALAAMIDHIDYPNFKDSVEDSSLHAAYVSVWCAMAGLQHPPPEIELGDPCKVGSDLEKHTVAPQGGFFLDPKLVLGVPESRAWGKGIDEHCHGQSANRRYFRAAISETSEPQPVLNCFLTRCQRPLLPGGGMPPALKYLRASAKVY